MYIHLWMPIAIDESGWPLTLHRAEGDISVVEMEAYLDRVTAFVGRGEPFATLMESRAHIRAERRVGELQLAWLDSHREAAGRLWLGLALVVPTRSRRLILGAALKVVKLPMPHSVSADVAAGARFLADRFTRAHLAPPARLAELLAAG